MLPNTALVFGILGVVSAEILIPIPPFSSVKEQLGVAFNSTVVDPPGLLLPLNVPLTQPSLTLPTNLTHGSYILLIVDPNADPPSYLHWLQTNLTASPNPPPKNGNTLLTSRTPAIDPYINPRPPPGTGPHRYIELLFQQPADFAIPASFAKIVHPLSLADRAAFNLSAFVLAAGLDAPVAANYFFAENSSATATATLGGSGMGTGTGPSSTSTVTGFTGGALKTQINALVVALGVVSVFGLGFLF